MSRFIQTGLTVTLLFVLALCLTGCSQSARIGLMFAPDNVSSQEVTLNVTKDFRFEQPVLNKLREEETSTVITTMFDQQIVGVEDSGWAEAKITLTGLKVKVIKNNDVQVDYDSTQPNTQNNPLSKLLGQSYTIKLAPNGKVEPLNITTVKTAGIPGTEGKIARRMFETEEIVRRHETLALPEEVATLKVGDEWSVIVPSPPGLLSSKSYKKTYTLESVNDNHAVVKMNAEESAVPAEGGTAGGGMGIFAKMLDNEDEYTGSMMLDLTTGQVKSYDETLVSTYLAQEANPQATPDQGPDTLRIRFIQTIERKQIN